MEILTTEQSYVDNLEIMVTFFKKPLSILGYVSAENLNAIFSNIEEIYSKNSEFLGIMRARISRWHIDASIGDLFVQHCHLFIAHKEFVTQFSKSGDILTSCKTGEGSTNFNTFLTIVKVLPHCGQQLSNLLIQPVQRIPRYVLLLSDLLKRTHPNHPDIPFLNQAITEVTKIAQDINESNRKVLAVVDYHKILHNFPGSIHLPENPNRGVLDSSEFSKVQFLKGADVKVKPKEKDQVYYVLLLSDFLVIAKCANSKRLTLGKDKTHETYKAICTLPINSSLTIKKLDKGIDFGVLIVEFENDEKKIKELLSIN